MMTRYRVVTDTAALRRQDYTGTMHGASVAFTPGQESRTPLPAGTVLTLVGYRPTSPGGDVIEAAWFRTDDGAEGFFTPAGPWGSVNPDALTEVEP